MKKSIQFAVIANVMLSMIGQAAIQESFTETFSAKSTKEAPPGWVPYKDTMQQTFGVKRIHGRGDGCLLLHRTATSFQDVGCSYSFGMIEAADVGKEVRIDFVYLHPNDGKGQILNTEIQVADIGVGGQGEMVIETFSSGNDPKAEIGRLSEVPLGSFNPQRDEPGKLTYTIQADDVGKRLSFLAYFYDSGNNGKEGLRDLAIDTFIYESDISTPDTLELVL